MDSGEVIHLASDVFKENGEKFAKMFRVFVGHSTGQPLLRHLLLTNLHIYLISIEQMPVENKENTRAGVVDIESGIRVGSYTFDLNPSSFLHRDISSFTGPSSLMSRGAALGRQSAVRYTVHLVMALSEIDCVTVCFDSLCSFERYSKAYSRSHLLGRCRQPSSLLPLHESSSTAPHRFWKVRPVREEDSRGGNGEPTSRPLHFPLCQASHSRL